MLKFIVYNNYPHPERTDLLHEKFIMPRSASSVAEAQKLIRPLVNVDITNEKIGMTAFLSNRSIKKLGSEKATSKSISPALHAKAIANIDILYKNADFDVTHSDYKNSTRVKQIHRLGTLMFDEKSGKLVPVAITVKEFLDRNANIVYSIEALDINKKLNSAGRTTGLTGGPCNGGGTVPITEFNEKMQLLLDNACPKS